MADGPPSPLHAGMKHQSQSHHQNPARTIPGPILQAPDIDPAAMDGDIARKAYFSYVDQGSQPGNDVRDWLDAENEIRAGQTITDGNGMHLRAPVVL